MKFEIQEIHVSIDFIIKIMFAVCHSWRKSYLMFYVILFIDYWSHVIFIDPNISHVDYIQCNGRVEVGFQILQTFSFIILHCLCEPNLELEEKMFPTKLHDIMHLKVSSIKYFCNLVMSWWIIYGQVDIEDHCQNCLEFEDSYEQNMWLTNYIHCMGSRTLFIWVKS